MHVASNYVQPTRADMEEVLKVPEVFKTVKNPVFGGELLYGWTLPSGVAIRVCSSVVPGYGGRDVGKDAIRVLLVHAEANHVFYQTTRVHRTKNWRTNMHQRIREVYDMAKAMPRCELCRTPLHQAISKVGNPYRKCVDPVCVATTEKPFRKGL
jgi:hypothetical protein